jgi:peptidoglycan/xylan/chitin deacetylase (PgdA/CDA1 family)
LGTHTASHAILTNYAVEEMRAQIQRAQTDIHAITGKSPEFIAYPAGELSSAVVDVARSSGMRFGFGVRPGRNRLPLKPGSRVAMTLNRFTLTGDCPIESQCRASRSLLSLYRVGRTIKRKMDSGFSPLQTA